MSGVPALGEVLLADAPLIAVVVDRIVGGALADNVILPSLVLNRISATELKVLSAGPKRRVAERVQVTVLANDYEEMDGVLKLVRTAGSAKIGDFGGVTEVSIDLQSTGPDFVLENPIMWCATQDFIVSYNEA